MSFNVLILHVFYVHALKIGNFLESKNLRLQLEKVSFYSIFLDVFVRFYRNFDMYNNPTQVSKNISIFILKIRSRSLENHHKLCAPANVVGFFLIQNTGRFLADVRHHLKAVYSSACNLQLRMAWGEEGILGQKFVNCRIITLEN